MPRIKILIPDGESIFTRLVVQCFDKSKFSIRVFSSKKNALIKYSNQIDSFVYIKNSEDILNRVIDELDNIDLVFPIDEESRGQLSLNKEKLGSKVVPLPEPDILKKASDKWLLYMLMHDNNISCPKTIEITEKKSLNFSFPILLKPKKMGNGVGIKLIKSKEELNEFNQLNKFNYIAQEYINGSDIDCSVLCLNGEVLSYTIQKGIISSKHQFRAPIGIQFLHNEKVFKIVKELMLLLNWSGVAHVDLRMDNDSNDIKVIEVNARYWGSLLGSKNAGINFPLLEYQSAVKEAHLVKDFHHTRFFMGKASILHIRENISCLKESIKETSIYYLIKDPKLIFFQAIRNLSKRMGLR